MPEPQKKGTPILMKFFGDAFAAHLNMVKVNLAIHQYRDAIAPSGESDNELLQAAIQAIGNSKPVVQNSLMTSKRILGLPDLPSQLVEDIDLHRQWCEISLQDLDLCDSTIRNLIMSKGDYLSILKEALDPYREALGIDEDYEYEEEQDEQEEYEADAEAPQDDAVGDDGSEEPVEGDSIVITPQDKGWNGSADVLTVDEEEGCEDNGDLAEVDARYQAQIEGMQNEMAQLQQTIWELSQQIRASQSASPGRIVPVMMGGEEDDIADEPIDGPLDDRDDIAVDEIIPEGEIVADDDIPEEPVIRQNARPTLMRIPSAKPVASPIKVACRAVPVTPRAVEEPVPVAPVVEDEAPIEEEPVAEEQAGPSAHDYEGLFGYDQYDSPEDAGEEEVTPLSEDPGRFQEIAEKASEVIAATKKKVGRTAAKSSRSSPKSKSGTARKPAKTGAKRTVKKKASAKATPAETDSETSSQTVREDE